MTRRRGRSEHRFDQAAELIVSGVGELQRLSRRHRRRKRPGQSRFARIVRAVLWALFATIAFVPVTFALGYALGPRALIVLPLLLTSVYGGLLWWALKHPRPPQLPPPSASPESVALLPAQTDDWLDHERERLPLSAQPKVDSISARLEALTPQLAALPADTPSAHEVRRLLGEELPQLIGGYHKVPRALAQQPLYGGHTPEQQLLEGLDTIDKQIGRLHEQLAKDDLHALATHQRYLELKYNRKDDVE